MVKKDVVFVLAHGLRLSTLVYRLRSNNFTVHGQHTASSFAEAERNLGLCGQDVRVAVLADSPGMVGNEAAVARQVADLIKREYPHITIVEVGSVFRNISEHFVGGKGMKEISPDDVVLKVRDICGVSSPVTS